MGLQSKGGRSYDMLRRKPSADEVNDRVRMLTSRFGDYVKAFDEDPAFTDDQLRHHIETCRLRNAEHVTASAAATDERFLKSLWDTLRSWRMQARGARLVEWPQFQIAFVGCLKDLEALDGLSLDDADLPVCDVADRIWRLIERMAISENSAKLVAGTKALHHLLPKLVVPMDRAFTGAFFGWNNSHWQYAQLETLRSGFEVFSRISRDVAPEKYIGEKWRSSSTKVIDNAVVAFCRRHLLDERSYVRALEARARQLGILDEIKADAKRIVEQRDQN
jgi:hypothetical protein